IRPVPGGGTRREPLTMAQRHARTLDDEQLRELADIADRVEAVFGGVPQDIEWCIAARTIYVVQARPITSLFPVPAPSDDGLRIWVSFGHLQMMLDPMPRLALEVWRYFLPAGKSEAPAIGVRPERSPVMLTAASRLFIDISGVLRITRLRGPLATLLGHAYPALAQSVAALLSRPEFHARAPAGGVARMALRVLGPVMVRVPGAVLLHDPAAGAGAFTRALEDLPRGAAQRLDAQASRAERIRRC